MRVATILLTGCLLLGCAGYGSLGGPYGLNGGFVFGQSNAGTCPPVVEGEPLPKDYPKHCIDIDGGPLSAEGQKTTGGVMGLLTGIIGKW